MSPAASVSHCTEPCVGVGAGTSASVACNRATTLAWSVSSWLTGLGIERGLQFFSDLVPNEIQVFLHASGHGCARRDFYFFGENLFVADRKHQRLRLLRRDDCAELVHACVHNRRSDRGRDGAT